jgi:cell volume regulation protein A
VLGIELRTAVILASVLSSTDAAAVFTVLRKLPLRSRIRSALEAESGLNDAPVAVLVVLASSDAWGSTSLVAGVGEVALELVLGVVIGITFGLLGRELLGRSALASAGLYPLAAVGLALLSFAAANALHGSGFLAVYLAGPRPRQRQDPAPPGDHRFASSLALLAEAGLFVLLGLLVSPERLPAALPAALLIGAVLTFVAGR